MTDLIRELATIVDRGLRRSFGRTILFVPNPNAGGAIDDN
jgi:hypothetical protein